MVTRFVVMSCSSVSRSITLHLERILWASPGFKQIKDRFLTWKFVHSTFHYRRFDISTLFKRPRMFCLATTTVLINCVSIKLTLSCETFQFSSVLWLLCAVRDLYLPVTCRRRFLRLQLCKLQLQHGWEYAGAARLLSESKVYCLSFVKTCLNWLCSANWIAPKQLRILCRQALAVTFHCWGRVVGVGLKVLPDWTKHNGNRFDRRAVLHPKQTQTTNDCTITFKFLTCVAV